MRTRLLVPVLGVFVVALLGGCKSSDSTGPTPGADLSGNYSLAALTQAGQPTVGPPIATGTLQLTATAYTVNILVQMPGQPSDTIADAGTYTTSGNQWSQTSSVQNVQSVGTYTLSNNVLTVNVTTQGISVAMVWDKQ